jgi:hypothetical protein
LGSAQEEEAGREGKTGRACWAAGRNGPRAERIRNPFPIFFQIPFSNDFQIKFEFD